ncbi:MAG: substrate-binding domain-containing protein [Bifidobacteriaceae bacterium]|jgi:ribose transport system substrate-binding protein|nr:substrate-binding domain-containing protein [Bifidobacteriaceae bacterium]
MKFKSTLAAVAAIAFSLTLASCGGSEKPSSTSSSSNSNGLIRVAFVAGITSDPFFRAMRLGAEEEAAKLGIDLIWTGSPTEYSPESQVPFVDAVLADQVDALILVPTDPDSLQVSVDKAIAQGVPVITVDTTVTDQSGLTAHITGDNIQGGALAAKTLAEQIGDEGEVFIISGSPTATTDSMRAQGFEEELAANYPGIKVVGTEYALSQPAKATSAVNTAMLNYPDLKGIFAINGTSGTGAVAALQGASNPGQIALIGYDAYANQVADLDNGVFTALIAQDPSQEARLALQDAKAAVTGEGKDKIERTVVIPNIVMTKANLADTRKYQYAE